MDAERRHDTVRCIHHSPTAAGASFTLPKRERRTVGDVLQLTSPAPLRSSSDALTWHKIDVEGRAARYGVGGEPEGAPVLFLHGWALGSRSYKRAIRRLTTRGCRVYAPAMPSFGGTTDLPSDRMDIGGYAAWVDAFLTAVGVDEPALVIGHSFGGGVAIKLAQTHPERVGYLVLLNSVGGVADRPTARDFPLLDGSALDDALNELAWSLDARDEPQASAAPRRQLVRRLGRRAANQALSNRSSS
jgi:pimeloyl-ACP methyl ester carboxylesterase